VYRSERYIQHIAYLFTGKDVRQPERVVDVERFEVVEEDRLEARDRV